MMLPCNHFNKTFSLINALLRSHSCSASSAVELNSRHVRKVLPEDIKWFPGHMRKSMTKMNYTLSNVDVIIEVHDSRLPYIDRPNFLKQIGFIRPYFLLMNKIDLSEPTSFKDMKEKIVHRIYPDNPPLDIIFTQLNAPEKKKKDIGRLMKKIPEVIIKEPLINGREFADSKDDEDLDFTIDNFRGSDVTCMVVGLPNSGKSTLINALRTYGQTGKAKAVRVGRKAGETRSIGSPVVVSKGSKFASRADSVGATIRVIDTPGILDARSSNMISQLSLAICGFLDYSSLNKVLLVDYMLFMLNLKENLQYVEKLKLPAQVFNVSELLLRTCANFDFILKARPNRLVEHYEDLQSQANKTKPDIDRACVYILQQFNLGCFGRITILPQDEEIASQFFTL